MSDPQVADAYDACLERLLGYGPEYYGNLSNHGPMALEALLSLGIPEAFENYVDLVVQKLDQSDRVYKSHDDWKQQLSAALPDLVALAGAQAGHGLLRVAHAVRALERTDSTVRRQELTAGLEYWQCGGPLVAPTALTGNENLADVITRLPRLTPDQKTDGLLIHNLETAAALPDVIDLIDRIAPAQEIPLAFLDLAETACLAETANPGGGAFALLHGVTVPMAAATLLPYLDDAGQRHLEAAVTGFIVAAIVGFDESSAPVRPNDAGSGTEHERLAAAAIKATETADDHDIKYVEACTRLFAARPSLVPITALTQRFNL